MFLSGRGMIPLPVGRIGGHTREIVAQIDHLRLGIDGCGRALQAAVMQRRRALAAAAATDGTLVQRRGIGERRHVRRRLLIIQCRRTPKFNFQQLYSLLIRY